PPAQVSAPPGSPPVAVGHQPALDRRQADELGLGGGAPAAHAGALGLAGYEDCSATSSSAGGTAGSGASASGSVDSSAAESSATATGSGLSVGAAAPVTSVTSSPST